MTNESNKHEVRTIGTENRTVGTVDKPKGKKEIESKYIINRMPCKEVYTIEELYIIQTYLEITEEKEERVRKIKNLNTGDIKYTHTIKIENNGIDQGPNKELTRWEEEFEIREEEYENLKKNGVKEIRKSRNVYLRNKDREIVIDELEVFADSKLNRGSEGNKLTLMEIEYMNEETAYKYNENNIGAKTY